jgi:hypothetical protein
LGRAVPLVNGGPPPSLRSAHHLRLHRQGETTGRARRCPNSAERNTSLCCRWIQAAAAARRGFSTFLPCAGQNQGPNGATRSSSTTSRPERVIGHDDVLVTQRTRSVRHLDDGAAAVGPERVRVTVASQRSAERIAGNSKWLRLRFQLREVSGDFARQCFQDYGLCCLTDSFQGAKPLVGGDAFQFAGFERGDCLAARRNAATRYVGACDRSNRNAIRFSASTGSMRSEPRSTRCVVELTDSVELLLGRLDSIPNDLPRGGHRGAGRLHVVTFAAPMVWARRRVLERTSRGSRPVGASPTSRSVQRRDGRERLPWAEASLAAHVAPFLRASSAGSRLWDSVPLQLQD